MHQDIVERDLRDETLHHGETSTDAKDEQHPPKVYGGNLMLYALAVVYIRACSASYYSLKPLQLKVAKINANVVIVTTTLLLILHKLYHVFKCQCVSKIEY